MRHISIAFCFGMTLLGAVACAEDPLVRGQMSDAARRADYPHILPLDELLANRTAPVDVAILTGSLSNRAAALRARASRLRAPIVDSATRTRMQAALARR